MRSGGTATKIEEKEMKIIYKTSENSLGYITELISIEVCCKWMGDEIMDDQKKIRELAKNVNYCSHCGAKIEKVKI